MKKITYNKHYNNILLKNNIKAKYIKHFVPLNNQWVNGMYSFDKINLSNTFIKQKISDELLKSYFNIIPVTKKTTKSKRMRDFLRRSSMKNIFVSNSEIKQTSDKLYITVYIFDRKKSNYLKKLYFCNNLKNIFYTKKSNKNLLYLAKILKKKSINNRYINNIVRRKKISLNKISWKVSYKNLLKKKQLFRAERFIFKKRIKIRKNYLKNSKLNIFNIFSLKRNIVKNFNEKFQLKFWTSLCNQFNFTMKLSKDNFILRWHNKFNMINPDFFKVNYSKKNLIESINNSVITYKLFNLFNILPKGNPSILVIKSKMLNYTFTNLAKNFSVKNGYINFNKGKLSFNKVFIFKIKMVNLIIITIVKKLILFIIKSLFGKKQANLILYSIWSNRFNNYYNNILKNTINKQIINIDQLLFNKDIFSLRRNISIPAIKNIIGSIYSKKIILNIVNMKYLHLNVHNFLEGIKMKIKKRRMRLMRVLRKSFKLVKLPKNLNMTPEETNNFTKYKNNYSSNNKFVQENINKLKYKYVTGVRLETKGRLTKRYTASRSVFKIKYKGNLKNLEYSKDYPVDIKKSPNMSMIRGYIRPNIQHKLLDGTRRIGTFGIKAWISGN